MSLQLPGELASLLDMLGYTWPAAAEDRLFEMGQAWIRFSATIGDIVADADAAAGAVWAQNAGQDIAAFQQWWGSADSPAPVLTDGATAAVLTGTGLIICGAVVLALKVAVIVQLTILAIQIAQAIAAAGPTFGASLLEIPIFQQITRELVGNLIHEAILDLADA
ncbi:hypothetical protein [Actinoplanes teichomyceticus]|uniref:Outer membrane channel protein CpnT-like N-terminal domain-containing protein n=1 Tax=Actinoplanes teichomyceticus TaxID=1867 RepID=A0A561WKT3_ACTTI|nr:hypothetical protein [Actinoplanes teichomyceticus]TWG24486.1 hypothetical protein FHX34_1021042 [Actinoplanes teichomyceticus]GIF12663.1 hypothetical protein Ate01nite_26950 [Actinoplanes teichomyceticus]